MRSSEQAIRQFALSKSHENIEKLANEISIEIISGKLTILQVVEYLESLLTNTDAFERARGVSLLVKSLQFTLNHAIISSGSVEKIVSTQAASVLLEFFLSRLDEQASVDDLLIGIVSLLDKQLVSKMDQLKILPRITQEINVQSYPQNSRHNIFQIFSLLLQHNLEGVKRVNQDFLIAFIHSMDGEKDPRNLLLLFEVALIIIHQLDFKEKVQDLFEVVFCYFPITFRPPENDIYHITADDLKKALRNVVSSTAAFATYSIPVLLEKLSSSSPSAKKDSIETISACLPIYSCQPFLPHLKELWSRLKTEIANGSDVEIEMASLKCLRDLTQAVSKAITLSTNSMSPLENLLESVLTECTDYFAGSDSQYYKPCGKIVASVASASFSAANFTVTFVMPVLLKEIEAKQNNADKHALFNIVDDIILSSRLVYCAASDKERKNSVLALSNFKEKLLEMMISFLLESSKAYVPLQVSCLRGLYELALFPDDLLVMNERDLCLSHLNFCALKRDGIQLAEEAQSRLATLSYQAPACILSSTILFIVNALEESADLPSSLICLEALVAVGKSEHTFASVMQNFFAFLESASSSQLQSLMPLLLKSCAKCIDGLKRSDSADLLVANQIKHIYSLIHNPTLTNMIVDQEESRDVFCHILNSIVRSMDASGQTLYFRTVKKEQNGQLIPNSPLLAILFQSILCNARKEVQIEDFGSPQFLINFISKLSLSASEHRQLFVDVASTIAGTLVNKHFSGPQCLQFLDAFQTELVEKVILNPQSPLNQRLDTLVVYAWIAKGLVAKADAKGLDFVSFLISVLNEETELAAVAAKGIEIVIKDDGRGYLTKSSFGVQKLLFKQRLYNYAAPLLVKGFEGALTANKNIYLMALSHLLLNVSKKTLMNELEPLFPMLLHSLQSTDANLKRATLETFSFMVEEASSLVSGHINTILHSLIKIFTLPSNANIEDLARSGNDPRVREMAIRLIGTFPGKIEYSILTIYKSSVLLALEKSLDDHKRVVRREAAIARGKWYMMTGVDSL